MYMHTDRRLGTPVFSENLLPSAVVTIELIHIDAHTREIPLCGRERVLRYFSHR